MKLIRMKRKIRPMKPVKKTDFIKMKACHFGHAFVFFCFIKFLFLYKDAVENCRS